MLRALLYLRVTSAVNLVLSRIRRLRQPKYLMGAIVGAFYIYFIYFRRLTSRPAGVRLPAGVPVFTMAPADLAAVTIAASAFGLLVLFLLMWLLPSRRPGLAFTEAETAFLFPAPISRRSLIHFKLLSGQFAIIFQSLFFALIFSARGLASARGPGVIVSWWIVLTSINLHYLGSSLTLAKLMERGVSNWRRRLFITGALAAIALGTFIVAARSWVAPTQADFNNGTAMARWLTGNLDRGPLHVILIPFKCIVRPYFATDASQRAWAVLPALLVLAALYYWVSRLEVSFEEASIARAEKRSAVFAAARSGKRLPLRPGKARRPAFALRHPGRAELAFLWKNLLATPPIYTPRVFGWVAAVIVIGARFLLRGDGTQHAILLTCGSVAAVIGGVTLLFGPQISRQDLRSDLANADILKTYPLAGWQVLLGETLTPVYILTGIVWLSLLATSFAAQLPEVAWSTTTIRVTLAAALALCTPALVAVLLLVPNAAALVFPAWFQTASSRSGGIDMMGQRLIFVFGQVLVMLLALLPAALAAIALFIIMNWLVGSIAGIAAGAIAVVLMLGGEAWCGLWWLGNRFEKFDLSAELRP